VSCSFFHLIRDPSGPVIILYFVVFFFLALCISINLRGEGIGEEKKKDHFVWILVVLINILRKLSPECQKE
jgi:hypothetical protein